ncbi:N-formylglutamate amidohydrolase [Dokdonella soli]|uniref:N-formylglutamate amidohydrolase n=1 Tax=Dokdonella soli TaxID=529810 RepID=A0ABP3TKH6_9GAMM
MTIADDSLRVPGAARLPSLLGADEPSAFTVAHADGRSPFVLICDHAGQRLPRALGDLGVSATELQRHIAWDIGAAGLARELARRLDAFVITQPWSRLVIDCNRPPSAPGSIVTRSEHTDIPGNRNLSAHDAQARVREIFEPYHARVAAELDRRALAKRPTILVSVHSFTPVYAGVARPWHLGVLYHRDARVAQALLALMREDGRWVVGDNEPYTVSDATDYAIPVHGERRGLPHVELEVRQDLISYSAGQAEWAERLAGWLVRLPDFGDPG